MANVLCKMCGGTVEVPEEVDDGCYGECPYCGTMMTFALRGGTLSVDFPACPKVNDVPQLGEKTPCNDGGGEFSFAVASELMEAGKYDELLTQSEAMLKKEPANPLAIALKATAICLLEADGDTEEIRIEEVASLFTAAFDGLASLDEAAAINGLDDAGVSKARNIISNLAMESIPLLATATMGNKLDYVIVADSEQLAHRMKEVHDNESGPDSVLHQIVVANVLLSRYPELEGIESAIVEKLTQQILEKIDERTIDSLSKLEVEDKETYLALNDAMVELVADLNVLLYHVSSRAKDAALDRMQLLDELAIKTMDKPGYDYVPDGFGAYHRVPWVMMLNG